MSFQIYDTRQRKKIPFVPIAPPEVRMYNCGPTVYDFAHIGNLRSFLFADTLRRWLEVSGYRVKQVMNLTDVDDKTIRKSQEEGVSIDEVTGRYIEAFFEDIGRLNVRKADAYPRATEHIGEMVEMVETLVDGGHAYSAPDGSVYFKVESYPQYGALSGKRLEDLRVGQRVSSDEYESKDDVRDFALWKAYDEGDGQVFWETEIGKGRPGWHIECSAMSRKHLGDEFDLHTGGVDNIFPHHENEIAQSRCSGDEFARHWMHCNYLIVEGKKMSKSLGNFFTLRDLLDKGYRAREIRYVLIGTHYRSQLNFTFEGLEGARSALQRLDDFRAGLDGAEEGVLAPEIAEAVERADRKFAEAMDDDLNVSAALGALFQFVREVNAQKLAKPLTSSDVAEVLKLWNKWDDSLGVLEWEEESGDVDEAAIEEMIEQRTAAKQNKDFALADKIRDKLFEMGVELRDGPEGTTWRLR